MLAFCLIEALLIVSLRKQPTFRDPTTGFPAEPSGEVAKLIVFHLRYSIYDLILLVLKS